MKFLYYIVIFLFLILSGQTVQAQDTIFIYENVYLTDTVWIDTPAQSDTTPVLPLKGISEATLLLDTIQHKATLLYFSPRYSATIPINRIYTNRTQLKSMKMKKAGFFTLMMLAFNSITLAQTTNEMSVYSIGVGFGNENNVSNYGLMFTNDYKLYLLDRLALNPRICFFQSTGSLEPANQFGYRSHSGLMVDFGLSYSIIKKQKSGLSINFGPSWEIGSETYRRGATFERDILMEETYQNNMLNRVGYYLDLEILLAQNDKFVHALAIKSNSYFFFAEYVSLVYKIGFKR